MKVIKTIGIVILVLVVLVVVVGLFLPSKMHVERSLVINAPQEQIFDQFNNLKNWDNWSAWNKMDPSWKTNYSENPIGANASYSWVSENSNVGKGKISITKSEVPTLVEAKMEFEGMEPALLVYKLEKVEQGVKVTASIDGDMGKNPFKKVMGLVMEKMVSKNYEKSLQDLSDYVKAHPAPAAQPEQSAEPAEGQTSGDSATQTITEEPAKATN